MIYVIDERFSRLNKNNEFSHLTVVGLNSIHILQAVYLIIFKI